TRYSAPGSARSRTGSPPSPPLRTPRTRTTRKTTTGRQMRTWHSRYHTGARQPGAIRCRLGPAQASRRIRAGANQEAIMHEQPDRPRGRRPGTRILEEVDHGTRQVNGVEVTL